MAIPVLGAGAIAGLWAALVKAISSGVFWGHVNIFKAKLLIRLGLFMLKVTAFALIIGLMADGIEELFSMIAVQIPDVLREGAQRIIPGNFVACLAAIISVKALVFVFAMSSKLISLFLSDV